MVVRETRAATRKKEEGKDGSDIRDFFHVNRITGVAEIGITVKNVPFRFFQIFDFLPGFLIFLSAF